MPGHTATFLKSRKHTQIKRNTLNPVFNEQSVGEWKCGILTIKLNTGIFLVDRFEFDVHFTELVNFKLQLTVKDSINYGLFTKQPTLGMVKEREITSIHFYLHFLG
jgi:hypothetical protein